MAIDLNGEIYASSEAGVYHSADCSSWTLRNSGLPGTADVLRIDPVSPTTLYAGLDGSEIYRSIDGGLNWTAANNQPTNTAIRDLTINPGDRSNLFAATKGAGVFSSTLMRKNVTFHPEDVQLQST